MFQCSICLAQLTSDVENVVTGCRHVYHALCLTRWQETRTDCPICREQLHGVGTLFLTPYTATSNSIVPAGPDVIESTATAELKKCTRMVITHAKGSGSIETDKLRKRLQITRAKLNCILDRYPGVFGQRLEETRRGRGTQTKEVVELIPEFECCSSFASGDCAAGDRCRKLHICKKFLLHKEGGCKKGAECRFGHLYLAGHNLRVVRKELELADVTSIGEEYISALISFVYAKRALGSSNTQTSRDGRGRAKSMPRPAAAVPPPRTTRNSCMGR